MGNTLKCYLTTHTRTLSVINGNTPLQKTYKNMPKNTNSIKKQWVTNIGTANALLQTEQQQLTL